MKKKSPLLLLTSRNTIAGLLSLLVITLYVADIGLQPNRLFKPKAAGDAFNDAQDSSAEKIATDIDIIQFDTAGHIIHQFRSERAEYFAHTKPQADIASDDFFDEGDMWFSDAESHRQFTLKTTEPHFQLYDKGALVAESSAKIGVGNTQNSRTEFIGEVHLRHLPQESELRTSRLMINPLTRQVLTREQVTIEGPNYKTTAQGLNGSLTDQRWQLMADVKSVVQPR
ncbi:MAG: LPS export ABC transporter periplasmic protein LptC [Pseudomonadales bacterium]